MKHSFPPSPLVAQDCHQQGMMNDLKTDSLLWLSKHSLAEAGIQACWLAGSHQRSDLLQSHRSRAKHQVNIQVEDSVACNPHRSVCWPARHVTHPRWRLQWTLSHFSMLHFCPTLVGAGVSPGFLGTWHQDSDVFWGTLSPVHRVLWYWKSLLTGQGLIKCPYQMGSR